ncbi:hypothetical protein IL306_007182 [Fusarium sp. DS 682]|nr:hypothetical protein IL306_007182 [Fusarium sp. DS 682]
MVEDPVLKRIVAAKELIRLLGDGKARSQPNDTRSSTGNAEGQNQTWRFLLRVANRIFRERALSQVEVVAYFQGYGTEFTNSNAWTFLNVCTMYWHVFRRWHHLRLAVGRVDGDEQAGETVMLGEAGQRISLLQAAAVQDLALFDPWDMFLCEASDDINNIWERHKACLPRRIAWLADNIQLLRRSAEDVALDARQWGVLSGESDPIADATGSHSTERDGSQNAAVYRPDGIGTAARLIDVLRNAITRTEITAESKEISAMVEQMYQFQETALASEEDLNAAIILNDGLSPLRGTVSSTGIPGQEQLRAIKSQQISLSREREKAIQGMPSWPGTTIAIDRATARGGSEGLEQQNGQAATAD